MIQSYNKQEVRLLVMAAQFHLVEQQDFLLLVGLHLAFCNGPSVKVEMCQR